MSDYQLAEAALERAITQALKVTSSIEFSGVITHMVAETRVACAEARLQERERCAEIAEKVGLSIDVARIDAWTADGVRRAISAAIRNN
jgi:hypothetical protein